MTIRCAGPGPGRAGPGVSPAESPALKVFAAAGDGQTCAGTMAEFSVRVSTGDAIGAGTWNKIAVSIVGTRGETPPLRLDHPGKEFSAGAVSALRGELGAEEGAGDGPLRSCLSPAGGGLPGGVPPGRGSRAAAARAQGAPSAVRPGQRRGPRRLVLPLDPALAASGRAPALPLLPVAGGRGKPGAARGGR